MPERTQLDLRHNSLNAMRLFLATLVIISHSFPISGLGGEPHLGDLRLGTFAVGGFFAISGYLICHSRLRLGILEFGWRRFLRIFPGYWLALIFTAFAAAGTGGLVRGGWSLSNAVQYVLGAADMVHGVRLDDASLRGAPLNHSWNGSLWTLRWEVACYIGAGLVLAVLPFWRRRWLPVGALILSSGASLMVHEVGVTSGPLYEGSLLAPYFLAGACMLRLEDCVKLSKVGAGISALTLVGAASLGYGEPLAAAPVAYLMIWAGAALPRALHRVGSRHDYSYGMYLYAFPIQQLLILTPVRQLGIMVFIVISVLATVPAAVVSWLAVEGPSLRAKRWLRRARHADGPTANGEAGTILHRSSSEPRTVPDE